MGHPTLSAKSSTLSVKCLQESYVRGVAKRMEKMINNRLEPLVGLAAPQIGESICLIAYKLQDKTKADEPIPLTFLANPTIQVLDKRPPSSWEAEYEFCASLPQYSCLVARPNLIRVQGLSLDGERVEQIH